MNITGDNLDGDYRDMNQSSCHLVDDDTFISFFQSFRFCHPILFWNHFLSNWSMDFTIERWVPIRLVTVVRNEAGSWLFLLVICMINYLSRVFEQCVQCFSVEKLKKNIKINVCWHAHRPVQNCLLIVCLRCHFTVCKGDV